MRKYKLICLIIMMLMLLVGVIPIWSECYAAEDHVGPHHAILGGPWELVVQKGLEGKGLHFPLKVADESKPQKLDAVLPIMGTAIKVKLDRYLPDLKWQTSAIHKPDAGSVAQIMVEGKNLEQQIWLSSDDPKRKSITSSIGSVTIYNLRDAKTSKKVFEELVKPGMVGLLTVWQEGVEKPLDFVVRPGLEIVLPGSERKIQILQYMPHYSINTKTKEVINVSEKPVNPAIKIRLADKDGKNTHEEWLWSKFQSSPHGDMKLPVQLKFTEINLKDAPGKYVLFTTMDSDSRLLMPQDGKMRLLKAELDKPYSFSQPEYVFRIEKIVHESTIVRDWVNDTNRLINPAFIVTIEDDKTTEQVILELSKPHHYKTDTGTYVFVYRRIPATVGHGNLADGK